MGSKLTMSYIDHSEEVSTCQFPGVELTAANFDATIALMTALKTAVEAVVLGVLWKRIDQAIDTLTTKTPPASTDAQRERKWIIIYEDTVTFKHYNCELPCADLSLLIANTDRMDISAGAGAALVTAFENYVKSPDGNAVEVQSVRHVGRNL